MNAQQQINLYQPIFRKQEKVFSARTMLFVFVGSIVFFTGIYAYARWNVYDLAHQSERLQQQYVGEVARLEDLSRRYPAKQKSRQIEEQLAELKKERRAKQFLLKTLSSRSIGNDKGFSAYFEGVARQRPEGMWLRHFELEEGGNVIGIHGSSLKPELVPEFLQRLAGETSFSGSSFRIFEMKRDTDNPAAINFSLRSISGGKQP
ncbi:PilN domain-containing protein [Sulfuriflexus mobilis]|uniref:PilN domain-containing protein n=1 Tax=Sulfuriflexus mobilis TaxID=1811807 RepID=UPI000F820C3C|nr:PilN domain-containing protein [Sulfuriflexus mobilis]